MCKQIPKKQKQLYQRPSLCTACQARSSKNITRKKSSRRSWNLRFHGFPNSMLATLCANKHQTSQKKLSQRPRLCAACQARRYKNIFRISHPEEVGIFRFRAFPNSMLGTLGPNNSRKQPQMNRKDIKKRALCTQQATG